MAPGSHLVTAPLTILTLEEGDDLLHRPKAAQALEGGESDGHFGLVVCVGIVLGELGMQLCCQLLERGQRSCVTSPGTWGLARAVPPGLPLPCWGAPGWRGRC